MIPKAKFAHLTLTRTGTTDSQILVLTIKPLMVLSLFTDKFDMRAIWNEALMEDAVCHAFVMLLEDVTRICTPDKYAFHLLFPRLDQVDGNGMQLLQVGRFGMEIALFDFWYQLWLANLHDLHAQLCSKFP